VLKLILLSEAYCNRGQARAEDYKGAIADFTQALRLAPDHADAYNKRGTVRAMLGYTGAMAEFDEALRKDPILLTPTTTEGLPTHRETFRGDRRL